MAWILNVNRKHFETVSNLFFGLCAAVIAGPAVTALALGFVGLNTLAAVIFAWLFTHAWVILPVGFAAFLLGAAFECLSRP